MAQITLRAFPIEGISYHGKVIVSTVRELRRILGDPRYENNTGTDKINFEWICETQDGEVFTIYDWQERHKICEDEDIEWHIGSRQRATAHQAFLELCRALDG